MLSDDTLDRIRRVKMLAMDVDGVLATPHIVIGSSDDDSLFEIKSFSVHDGAAFLAARAAGLLLVVLSGRDSPALRQRLDRLQVDASNLGDVNKIRPLHELLERFSLTSDEVCYVGDDFLDLPVMRTVGAPMSVADGTPEMRAAACYVTQAKGGEGVAAEIIRLILQTQDKWDAALEDAISRAYADSDGLRAHARY